MNIWQTYRDGNEAGWSRISHSHCYPRKIDLSLFPSYLHHKNGKESFSLPHKIKVIPFHVPSSPHSCPCPEVPTPSRIKNETILILAICLAKNSCCKTLTLPSSCMSSLSPPALQLFLY